jgi:hypothetical protein
MPAHAKVPAPLEPGVVHSDIHSATRDYERWLGSRVRVVPADLETKHERMRADAFSFLRATFYRWMQWWPVHCRDLERAPQVLAVGDLHVENFGTWRDREGRLNWGINDFDEATPLPYTADLVRLATSAQLAIAAGHLGITREAACAQILIGYREGLRAGGQAFVLEERHAWLRALALAALGDPAVFWAKLQALRALPTKRRDASALRLLRRSLPDPDLEHRVVHRVAGMGSLGRERLVALGEWCGGLVAREAKALLPSAALWACGDFGDGAIRGGTLLEGAVRCPDPMMRVKGAWVVRRLAPDSARIEVAALPKARDEARLLRAMGFETANVHLGTKKAIKRVLRDLERRDETWLEVAAHAMAKAALSDWEAWRNPKR